MINFELRGIYISGIAGLPMESKTSVEVDMKGIEGDRYHLDESGLASGTHSVKKLGVTGRIPNKCRVATVFSNGDFESSLEQFKQMLIDKGLNPMEFTPAMMRRNFYVLAELGLLNELLVANETIRLNGSDLLLKPIERCTPCNLPTTYILDPKKQLKPGMDGYEALAATQTAFKTAFAETAGIRVGIIEPGRASI